MFKPISIMLLDDHELIHQGILGVLRMDPGFSIAGSFTRSRELVQALQAGPVDIVIVDYSLDPSDADGISLIRLIKRLHDSVKVLVLSAHRNPVTIALAMKAGADGFCIKSAKATEIPQAIRRVMMGKTYIPPEFDSVAILNQEDMLTRPSATVPPVDEAGEAETETSDVSPVVSAPLTAKEREILRCFLDGMSINEIAAKFSRSKKTVSGHKQSACRKLGVRTDSELFKLRDLIR
jgi:DNA-binding NarL/FixJ family response regulator